MNKFIFNISWSAVALATFGFQSCVSDEPFSDSGEGSVSFRTEMHSDVEINTRALDAQTKKTLEDNLTVYIENNKGVIRKYLGKENIPSNLTLNSGDYAIEGWTGDSVSASYTQKFYRGYQKFKITPGENVEVKFNVNIANVIVSVDKETLSQEFKDFKVTFSHSRGLLDFNRESVEEGKKGYFMMPNSEADLYYKIELESQLGEPIVKEGYIRNVERAHEYSVKVLAAQPDNDLGASMVKIEILDIPVIDKSLNVYPAPVYYAQVGASLEEFDVANRQIDFSEKNFSDVRLRIAGYGGLANINLNFKEPFTGMESINGVNLRNNNAAQAEAIAALSENNIDYSVVDKMSKVYDDAGETSVQECWLIFHADFFRNLPESELEYAIEIKATDSRDISASSSLTLRFANTSAAVDKKEVESLIAPDTYDTSKPMAILATSAELQLRVLLEDASDYGIEYRKKNSDDSFQRVTPASPIAPGKTGVIRLTGLEPDTEYEYRAYSDDFTEQNLRSFVTEKPYEIPNYSLENWASLKSTVTSATNVPVPTESDKVEFWDSGNHGSRSVSLMATTLTEGSTDMAHDGNMSAKLISKFVGLGNLGRFGTGNLFTGEFAGTDGMDGILHLGRLYNGSHPSSLNVYVNYRPGTVASNVADNTHFKTGDKDKAQIYVALTTDVFEVRTKDQARLFDPYDESVVAYGQITIEGDVGDTNQMVLKNIKFKYKDSAKNIQPTHLVIVCAASKYGDYFTGGEGTTMYVDDFHLLYDNVEFGIESEIEE